MPNEFTPKPARIKPAISGTIARADDYNKNIAGQSKGAILGIDADGEFDDVDLGDQNIGSNGALISDLKLRNTAQIRTYDNLGALDETINFGQATEIAQGTAELATQAEVDAGTDDLKIVTAKKLLGLFNASSQASNGYARIPINVGGAFDEIIIQWGNSTVNAATTQTISFPLTFPNALFNVVLCHFSTNVSIGVPMLTNQLTSTSQFKARNNESINSNAIWIAIGH